MRKLFLVLMLFPLIALSQNGKNDKSKNAKADKSKSKSSDKKTGIGIGLKAGLNFANVTGASSINSKNKTGYMIGAFLNQPSGGLISYRLELTYSKQGFDFKTNTNTGTVNQSYILIPTLMGIKLGKFALLEFGMQTAYLLNSKADTTSTQTGTDPSPFASLTKFQNRVSLGGAAGFEIYPFKGILVGARYNISFGDMFKMPPPSSTTPPPSFLSSIDIKNNVVQFYLGYRF